MQKRIYDLQDREWLPLRPDITREVAGISLIPEGLAEVKIVLTRVAPGGEFAGHRDPYHHIFFFLEGQGRGWLDGDSYEIQAGRVVEVPVGVEHGYQNAGDRDLLLLTVNIPVR